jgi:hypothetical protein
VDTGVSEPVPLLVQHPAHVAAGSLTSSGDVTELKFDGL